MTATNASPVGEQLRQWRQRRRRSQLDLALDADISQRHLSYVESGRARPSRDMILHLCEHLEVPLRDRNSLLLAAGFAPVYPERSLSDPDLAEARRAVERVLALHDPFPAIAVDRTWTMLAANPAVAPLMEGVEDPALLQPPVNVLRLSLHPKGVLPRIVNARDWRQHVLLRLRHQVDATGDAVLIRLLAELEAFPEPPREPGSSRTISPGEAAIALPLAIRTPAGVLSFITTTTVFGAPMDVTLAELAIEAFYPADEATAAAMRAAQAGRRAGDQA